MKLSFEVQKEIYFKHLDGYGYKTLSKLYHVHKARIQYFCQLVDKHGLEILLKAYTSYSDEFKLKAVKRVLEDNEPIWSVPLILD